MKRKVSAILMAMLMMALTFGLAACGGNNDSGSGNADEGTPAAEEATETVDGTIYGYSGDDPATAEIYRYMIEEIGQQYDLPEGSVSIPVVQIVAGGIDDDGEMEFAGDFWVFNYEIEGDTLKMISGGDYPGKMELVPTDSGYAVKEFDQVKDGEDFEESARDIFEESYDAFININSDEKTREKERAETIAVYVKANGLNVTKYQDEGWDPVELKLD